MFGKSGTPIVDPSQRLVLVVMLVVGSSGWRFGWWFGEIDVSDQLDDPTDDLIDGWVRVTAFASLLLFQVKLLKRVFFGRNVWVPVTWGRGGGTVVADDFT